MAIESSDKVEQLAPSVTIEAADRYLIGLPIIVAVICENTTDRMTYYFLPDCNPFTPPRPFTFTLKRQHSGEIIAFPEASLPEGEGLPAGFTLEPREARRMLCDLSLYNRSLTTGAYQLEATYHTQQDVAEARPVDIEMAEPPPADEPVLNLLRSVNDMGKMSWGHFVRYNWRTIYTRRPAPKEEIAEGRAVDATGLSKEGREALALHLFLHRATYGTNKIAALDPSHTDAFARGPLEGEAAVLRYEILVARDDPSVEKERAKIVEQFPGLKWRVEAVENRDGRLTRLRRIYGAEQDFMTEPEFFPYTEQ